MHVLRYGAESRKPSQFIKIVNACINIWSQCIKVGDECITIWKRVFLALCDNFRHSETYTTFKNSWVPTARAYNYYGCCRPPAAPL